MKDCYSLDDLRNWSSATHDLPHPARLAVLGHPVAHSLSPAMQQAALDRAGVRASYVRIDVAPEEFREALRLMAAAGFIGANVTIPLKQAAFEAVDAPSEHAQRMKAVNTIVFEADQSTSGFSTDGPGLVRAIREEFLLDVRDLRVLVLGAGGGAGRSIAVQCALERCERLVLVNRTLDKAMALAAELKRDFSGDRLVGPGDRLVALATDSPRLEEEVANVDLIINATSLGMKRSDPSPLPSAWLTASHLVYDTVYAQSSSRLLDDARSVGARAANGLSMLVHQGALSFELWFGREPDLAAMKNALHQSMQHIKLNL